MSVAGSQHCARGARCKLYDPSTGKSQKLGLYHKGEICDRCKNADADADFEAHQRRLTATYKRVSEYRTENSPKAQLVAFKRRLVAQMITKRGSFWEALQEVRGFWKIGQVKRQLPEESERILYPPNLRYVQFSDKSRAVLYSLCATDSETKCEAGCKACTNRRRLWQSDLDRVLSEGGAEKYLEGWRPYIDTSGDNHAAYPPVLKHLFPWYKFAAACVLFDVPISPEEAEAFADYGGLPEEPLIRVQSPQELQDRKIARMEQSALDEWACRKIWELRSELGELDYDRARYEVMRRFSIEAEATCDRAREERELEMELDPDPPFYDIKYVPEEHSDQDVRKTLSAIRKSEKQGDRSGRKRGDHDELLPVLCAALIKEGRSPEILKEWAGLSPKRIKQLAQENRNFLEPED